MNAVVNVSFCCSHRKGGEGGPVLDEAEHWEWLKSACRWWQFGDYFEGFRARVIVSATGYRGPLHVEAGRARDALWHITNLCVPIIGDATNPGHQVGAGTALRLGLEYAGKLGYPYLIHTAEDVLPLPGVVGSMLRSLEAGDEYAGDHWAPGSPAEGLNAQFFACRVPYLAGVFDPGAIPAAAHIEGYLRGLLRGRRLSLWQGGPGSRYRHTHDPLEWKRWSEEPTPLSAEGGGGEPRT